MISDVRAYARSRLKVLKYTEHTDGFNFHDIPKTKLDKAFHLELGQVKRGPVNNDNFHVEVPLAVRLFRAPSRDPKSLIDRAIGDADLVIQDFCRVVNRTTFAGIKNVLFETMAVDALADSDDNGVIIKLEFMALVVFSAR